MNLPNSDESMVDRDREETSAGDVLSKERMTDQSELQWGESAGEAGRRGRRSRRYRRRKRGSWKRHEHQRHFLRNFEYIVRDSEIKEPTKGQ